MTEGIENLSDEELVRRFKACVLDFWSVGGGSDNFGDFQEELFRRLNELVEAKELITELAYCSECYESPEPSDGEWTYCSCKNFGIESKWLRKNND